MTDSIELCTSDQEWDWLCERADQSTVFHQSTVLAVLETYADATLHRLVGYKGQEPVGLFPVFELRRAGVTAVFSPPPQLGVSFLGPLSITDDQLKQRKRERRGKRFVDACLSWIEDRIDPRYIRICTVPEYEDVRPFVWADYDVSPQFTYEIDLTRDREAIKRSFSRTPRRNVEDELEVDFRISVGGTDDIRFVHEQIRARYEAQDKTYTVPPEFLVDLYDETPEVTVQPYVGRLDGDPIGGLLTFRDGDTVYFAQGGGKPLVDVPCNDRLHWRVMTDAKADGCIAYDLHGANTPRICEYKSKFNPDLRAYYEIESGTPLLTVASKVYRRIR